MGQRRARGTQERDSRREVILAAAAQILDASDFDDLSMNNLAAAVGLSKGALYLYFPSRAALLEELATRDLGVWLGALSAGLLGLKPGIDASRISDLLVTSLLDRPRLLATLKLPHTSGTLALLSPLAAAGEALERLIPALPVGQGALRIGDALALSVGYARLGLLLPLRGPPVERVYALRGAVTAVLSGG